MIPRSKPFLSALCFSVAALAAPRSASADPTAADSGAAQVLFEDALRLMKSGKPADVEQACPKLVESQRLDPGIGTLLNLGICYEAAGKTASSYGAYGDAAVMARNAGDKARQDESERRAKVMEAKLSKLVVSVALTSRAPGLTVKRDGREVAEALWGAAIPVDPGEHAIEASAPGKKTWTGIAHVPATSGSMTVEIAALEEAAPMVGSGPVGSEGEPPASGWSSQRKAGVIIGSVGLAGVVVGSVFGLLVGGKKSDSAKHCQVAQPNVCDAAGVALREDAYTFANVSNAMFAVGGAAVIGGVVVFLTAPSEKKVVPSAAARIEARPMVTTGTAGLLLRGEW